MVVRLPWMSGASLANELPTIAVDLDVRQFPIVRLRYMRPISDEEFEDMLQSLVEIHAHMGRYVAVVSGAPGVQATTMRQRLRGVAWIREHRAFLRDGVLGWALVLSSPITRAMFSSVLLAVTLPNYAICSNEEEAFAWARARVEETGLARP